MQQPRRADRRSVTVKCLSASTLDPHADQDAWMYPPPWGGATPSHRSEGDKPGLGAFARDSWNLRSAHIYALLRRNKGPVHNLTLDRHPGHAAQPRGAGTAQDAALRAVPDSRYASSQDDKSGAFAQSSGAMTLI